MPDSWEDLVTPVRRVANAMVDYLPGYATERERFQRRVENTRSPEVYYQGGEDADQARAFRRREFAETALNAMNAIGVRGPGPYGWAARAEAIPQRDAAVTGGGSRYDPSLARNNSMELGNRTGVETAGDIRTRYAEPPRRELRTTANDNSDRPFAVQTKGDGGNRPPRPAGVDLDEVLGMLKRYNLPVERVHTAASTNTRYVTVRDPNGGESVTIRIPGDSHLGNPDRAGPPGQFFDTGSARQSPSSTRHRGGSIVNEGGERFSSPEALEAALKWRFPNQVARTGENFLVRPDQAPAGAGRTNHQSPPRPIEGADFSPDQPRLLAVGAPAVAGIPIWQNVPELAARESDAQSNVGRFAAPIASPDAQLAADTRSLSDRVSVATRNIEADFDFSDLVTPVTPHARAGMRQSFNAMAGR